MIKQFRKYFYVLTLGFAAVNCSKKEVKTDGDVTPEVMSPVGPTDVASAISGVGSPIPELNAVLFAYDSFALSAQAKTDLNQHADWMKANPARSIQIEGHTDERGTTEYNLALGERRSGAVRDYLVGKGIPASQLSTISYGEERPAAQGSDESAWAKNRRAEFVSGR